MRIRDIPLGQSLTITGDNERITWTKIHNGKYVEVIRNHRNSDGKVKEFSEPLGIKGFVAAEEELAFRLDMLGWKLHKQTTP